MLILQEQICRHALLLHVPRALLPLGLGVNLLRLLLARVWRCLPARWLIRVPVVTIAVGTVVTIHFLGILLLHLSLLLLLLVVLISTAFSLVSEGNVRRTAAYADLARTQ